jgi:hypothetical protein
MNPADGPIGAAALLAPLSFADHPPADRNTGQFRTIVSVALSGHLALWRKHPVRFRPVSRMLGVVML